MIVQGSRDSRNDTDESTVTEEGHIQLQRNKDIVESPTEEVSLAALEKTTSMTEQPPKDRDCVIANVDQE